MHSTILFRKVICNFKIIYFLLIWEIQCHPIPSVDSDINPEEREERRFPNGTVVGRYTYLDSDGTPVQVRYFANDSSYGVELKSEKHIIHNKAPPQKEDSDAYKFKGLAPSTEPQSSNSEFLSSYNYKNHNSFYNKHGSGKFDVQDQVEPGNHHRENFRNNLDYDIYERNELKSPKKCGKEKLHVYVDKSAMNSYDIDNGMSQFCNKY